MIDLRILQVCGQWFVIMVHPQQLPTLTVLGVKRRLEFGHATFWELEE